jgi:flagellar basal body L-ring protein FlgH
VKVARILLLALVLAQTGCAEVLGRLRPDLDDSYGYNEEPVRGGFLSELGYVSGEPDRGIASEKSSGGWVDRMSRDANLRDRTRSARSADAFEDQESLSNVEADGVDREERPLPPMQRRVTRNDFVDDAQEAGSLWSTNGQTNFFFSKNKTRTPGDLININIEADLLRDLAAEVKRALRPEERDYELSLLSNTPEKGDAKAEAKADKKTDEVKQSSASPDLDARAAYSKVDLSGVIGVKAGDTFLAEVVERYPNGNYKIRGTKRIPFRGTTKLMTLVGVVRGSDLTDDDKVNSGRLYEYRLEVVR